MGRNRGQAAGVRAGGECPGDASIGIAEANLRWAFALVATLNRADVEHFVVSSGARSAPLALAVAQLDSARIWPHLDERCAGFWAIGIGKASGRPAALICTSGTAAANYYPAVIEARYSQTPLIILTADRPPRLRCCGAPQTIDQVNMYAQYPRLFHDLPVPGAEPDDFTTWIEAAARAAAIASGPPGGPVHLNVPFDEPLVPAPSAVAETVSRVRESLPLSLPRWDGAARTDGVPASTWDNVAGLLRRAARPLIVVGPQNDLDDLATDVGVLAERVGAPVLADIASLVRFNPSTGSSVIAHYDLFLRDAVTAGRLVPDCVLRLGGLPTSRTLNEWLAAQDGLTHIAIQNGADPADPYGCVTNPVKCNLRTACTELLRRLPPSRSADSEYSGLWLDTDETVRGIIRSARSHRAGTSCFEGDFVAVACETAPSGAMMYLANSLSIRMADMFAERTSTSLRVLVNRGANGIDGLVSSAGGTAVACGRPVVLVIGDLAFLHDIGGLAGVSRHRPSLEIVLINNDGGGIFSFLPVSEHQDIIEPLIAMPHGSDFSRAAAFFNIPYERTPTLRAFENAYRSCFAHDGPAIIEVQTSRAYTKSSVAAITQGIAQSLGGVT